MSVPDPVPADAPVCILFALPDEAKPFQAQARARYGHVRPASVAVSGVGMQNATRTAEAMHLSMAHCLLICGFAGGLSAGLLPGTLVIGEAVTSSAGETFKADSRLLAVAESVRLPGLYAMRGMIYTGDKVLGLSAEKQELAGRCDAIAVDMETFGAAQVAARQHVPWLAVRVVTDGVDDDMPLDFNALAGADGNVDKKRVVGATLAQPWKIPALIRLGARSFHAAKNLALFLEAYLQSLPDVNA